MNRLGLLLLGGGLLSGALTGCAILGFDPTSTRVMPVETHRAALLIRDLYGYSEALQAAKGTENAWQYTGTEEALASCEKPPEALRVALQLSMEEPESGNWEQAQQLLETCLAQAQEPLLIGYIQNELTNLQRLEESRTETLKLRRSLTKQQQQRGALQNRLQTLKTQQEETQDTEATVAQSRQAEVARKEAEVQTKDAEIQTLEARIATLEAKLRSLTTIEQRLNQEEQKQTP